MTIGSILLGLALLALVGLYLARPLLAPAARRRRQSSYSELQDLKESYLTQIRSLDFDYTTGKIPEENYQQQRAELMAGATDVLKRMDALEGAAMPTEPAPHAQSEPALSDTDIDADIEAAVYRMRQSHHAPASTGSEPDVVSPVAPATANGEPKFCPKCGQGTDPGDKFCVNCGTELKYPQPV
ncbi:MAG: zinc ribbon domain-containing protein [Candidatus Promineifilaceae bacterium]